MMAINIVQTVSHRFLVTFKLSFIHSKKKNSLNKMGNCLGLDGDGNANGGGGGPTAEERRRLQLAAADRRT